MTLFAGNRELLEQFRQGNPAALEQVFRHFVGLVEMVIYQALKIHGWKGSVYQDKLDLIQETFIKAFSQGAREAFDGIRDYKPYLLTICRNTVIDWARQRKRELLVDFSDQTFEVLASTEPPDEQWADPVSMRIVESYLAALPSDLADVHYQRFVLSVSQNEAARALGITRQKVRTLEKKLQTGLKKLLRRLKKQKK